MRWTRLGPPLALLLLLPAACKTPRLRPPPGAERELLLADPPPRQAPPEFVGASGGEWVRLTSGEWLRGELVALAQDTLEFESEELDQLKLDWADVSEVHTRRPFAVLLENRAVVTGELHVVGDVVRVAHDDGEFAFHRRDVQRIVTGSMSELDRWSGKGRVGFTARRGNTDQTDTSLGVEARRRTSDTRLDLALDVLHSEQGDAEVANNQRFRGNYDVFLTSRVFLTPLGLELYSDRFQNIDLRATPYTGVGYVFAESGRVDWSGTAGLGYRWTRYDSVEAGADREDEELVTILATTLESDLTEKLELDATYQVQLSFDGLEKTQHNASVETTYDVWGDLDFVVGLVWTRIGDPQTDADGNTPDPDDVRLDVGLAWTF